jgi:spermidine/putrescine transport system permease protein
MLDVAVRPAPAKKAAPMPSSKTIRMPSSRLMAAVPVYVWLLLLVVAPNALLLAYSFWTSGDLGLDRTFTLNNYLTVLTSSTNTRLIIRTVGIALAVALFATLLAFPMAFIVSQKLKRGRMVAVMLVVVPLWVSLLIRVFAWKIILGDTGVLNTGLMALGVIDRPIGFLLYTRFTVFLTLMTVAIPFVFVAAYTSLERVPKSVLEASSDLGASSVKRFTTVIWPLARQGVAIGFTLAFVLAVGDYLSPSLVGGLSGTMVGSVIVSQFGVANNWPLGAALAIILLAVVTVVAAAVARAGRATGVLEGDTGAGISTDAVPGSQLRRRIADVLSYTYLAFAYGLLYLPLLAIAVFSLNDSRVQTLPIKGLSFTWYRQLLDSPELIAAFQRSVIVAVGAVVISLLFGIVFALIFAYRTPRGAGVLQGALTLPFLLPGVILGLSLAIVFRTIGLPFGLTTVILGHATFITPIVMAVLLARLRQMDPSLVHAALDLGATPVRAFAGIVLPQLRTAFVGAALLGFTLSFDEVLVTFFLTGEQPTLPVYIYNQLRFGFTPTINALFTCIVVASVALLLMALKFITGRNSGKASTEALALG